MNIHKTTGVWNYNTVEGFYGGKVPAPNQSTGYHGLLQQWWDYYKPKFSSWLLISEKNTMKSTFTNLYPYDKFTTLEYYANENEVDHKINLCDRELPYNLSKFNIVLCQATLEHVYDPFTAMYNMASVLDINGIMLIHTHVPGYFYHPHPKDYLRYFPDWFIDIPNYISNIELLELFDDNGHIFAAYRKL